MSKFLKGLKEFSVDLLGDIVYYGVSGLFVVGGGVLIFVGCLIGMDKLNNSPKFLKEEALKAELQRKKVFSKEEIKSNVADRTNLHYSIINNDTELTKAFLEQGGDVNAKDANGNTALILAAKTGRKELCEALIAAGADVNAQNKAGETALIWAAARKFSDVAQVLVEAKADVNIQSNVGYTALHEAAQKGCLEMVQYLIAKGADVNAKTKDGMTALNLATKYNRKQTAMTLLEAEKKQAVKKVAKKELIVENFVEQNQRN